MINGKFALLSEEDRNAKLKAVLNQKTAGCLSDAELQHIIGSLVLNKQYDIFVYSGEDDFRKHIQAEESIVQTISEGVIIAKLQRKGAVKELHILISRTQFFEVGKKEIKNESEE